MLNNALRSGRRAESVVLRLTKSRGHPALQVRAARAPAPAPARAGVRFAANPNPSPDAAFGRLVGQTAGRSIDGSIESKQ